MNRLVQAVAALLAAAAIFVVGCEGATFGENSAGSDTFLGFGAIAVDHLTDTVFLLQRKGIDATADGSTDAASSTAPAKARLVAVQEDGTAKALVALDGATDVRLLFPSAGVLLMSEHEGKDTLRLLDRGSLDVVQKVETNARYHGTRLSASRRWVAVADNAGAGVPIHVIDSENLQAREVPHGGAWLEAMWLRKSDSLTAAVFETGPLSGEVGKVRLHMWSIASLQSNQFAVGEAGLWTGVEKSFDLGEGMPGLIGTMSWIAVSPTDASLAVPLLRAESLNASGKAEKVRAELAVVDLQAGKVHAVPDAFGPVSYTADGSTIVAFRPVQPAAGDPASGGAQAATNQRELVLVHLPSMATETVAVPVPGLLSFFVSHAGSWVVMTTTDAGSGYLLHDLSTGKTTQLSTSGGSLASFVSRPPHDTLYLLDGGQLDKLSMAEGTVKNLPLPFVPGQINYLPGKDLLVVSEQGADAVHFLSPVDGAVVYSSVLPPL